MKNTLRKLIILNVGMAISVICAILNLQKGWGLEAKSWPWVLGCTVFGAIFAQIIIALAKDD